MWRLLCLISADEDNCQHVTTDWSYYARIPVGFFLSHCNRATWMAFMTPIIKPGWNLYNCNPPPAKARHTKSKPKKSATAKNGTGSNGATCSSSSSSTSSIASPGSSKNAKHDVKVLQRRYSCPDSVNRTSGKTNKKNAWRDLHRQCVFKFE